MFTGIIEEIALVKSLSKSSQGSRLSLKSELCLEDTKVGDSISVDGCCLTVVQIDNGTMRFDVSAETLAKSNLGNLKSGTKVNLERALRADSRLDGHFVTGHIDNIGKIISRQQRGEYLAIEIGIPEALMLYLAEKGSIAVDGMSLTVSGLRERSFVVYIIPHTIVNATLNFKQVGDTVNIEVDLLAKYIQRHIEKSSKNPPSNISRNFLQEHGFI